MVAVVDQAVDYFHPGLLPNFVRKISDFGMNM